MILHLKNFKCFSEAKFSFADDCNTLVTASSGYGKTSIFDAIRFVIWGNRDVDLISYGKKKCEVVLEYKGLTFKRTKNPNFFSIICSKKGTLDNPSEFVENYFGKYPSNFLKLSGVQKLQLLETISSNKNNVEDVKDKLKILISEGNKTDSKISTDIKIIEETLGNLGVPENLEHPGNPPDAENVEEMREKYTKMKTDNEKFYKIFLQNCMKENDAKEIESAISLAEEDIRTETVQNFDEILAQHEHLKNANSEIARLKSKVLKNCTLSDCEILESKIFQMSSEILKYEEGLKKIANLKKMLKISDSSLAKNKFLYVEKGTYECPSCGVNLDEKNGKLIQVKECSDMKLYRQLKEEEDSLKIPSFTRDDLKSENSKLKKIRTSLEAQEEISEISSKISNQDFANCERLAKKVSEIFSKNRVASKLRQDLKNFNHERDELEHLERTKNLEKFYEKLQSIQSYDRDVKIWEKNEKLKDKITEYREKLVELEHRKNQVLQTVEKLERLKKEVEEAQMQSLKSLIDMINYHIELFCNVFFEEDFDVKLEQYHFFTSTKNSKPQIEVKVVSKGIPVKLECLSSGEHARVSLAVDLAFYSILDSSAPLLLDEVAANLDSDTASRIFNFISQKLLGKTVITIAHQAVEGIFDHVIVESDLDSCVKKIA